MGESPAVVTSLYHLGEYLRKQRHKCNNAWINLGDIMKPIIREARAEDKPFIEEIAKLTWEGEDYLARVFDNWVKDGI